jgi:hypothetical protein
METSTLSAYAGVDLAQTPHMLAYVPKGSPIGITADTGLLDLLDAQRAQLKDEYAYAERRSNSALSAVLPYKSLAGGWPQRPPQPPKGVNP